jgi:hypothetical protein
LKGQRKKNVVLGVIEFMKLFWLLLLLCVSISKTNAQLPEHWGVPTSLPIEGSDRVILYTNDSAQVALKMLPKLLKAKGFQVDFHDRVGLTTPYKMIAEITGMKGSGALAATVVVSQELPGILTLSGSSISQSTARGMIQEIPTQKKAPHKHKSNASVSAFGKANSEAVQNGFNALIAIAKAYPDGRVMYVKTGK